MLEELPYKLILILAEPFYGIRVTSVYSL
ncbi:hypothetical protein [Escherichia phage IMM-001]|nr:hypothetical protein [Escherichia phage IMM-001]